MGEVKTNWTKATTNPSVALAGLISCIEYGCKGCSCRNGKLPLSRLIAGA